MRKHILSIFLLTLLVSSFQACSSNISFQSAADSFDLKSDMNGEGYSGKPDVYNFLRQEHACLEKGANGKPLPNSQIFVFPGGKAQLVRENCADIQPRPIGPQEYSVANNGDLIYQNQTFAILSNQSPFDVVAASCPTGQTLLANPVRQSYLQAPLDLQDPVWEHAGLAVDLVGSLASLPLYQVKRNDPNALESWHRMAQSPLLVAGETYAFSFFVKPDPVEKAQFVSYYPNVQDVRIEFDLLTGAATIQSTSGVQMLGTSARMFAGGLYINIFFRSLSSTSANMGVASSGQFLGSSILASTLQFEKVSNFCGP